MPKLKQSSSLPILDCTKSAEGDTNELEECPDYSAATPASPLSEHEGGDESEKMPSLEHAPAGTPSSIDPQIVPDSIPLLGTLSVPTDPTEDVVQDEEDELANNHPDNSESVYVDLLGELLTAMGHPNAANIVAQMSLNPPPPLSAEAEPAMAVPDLLSSNGQPPALPAPPTTLNLPIASGVLSPPFSFLGTMLAINSPQYHAGTMHTPGDNGSVQPASSFSAIFDHAIGGFNVSLDEASGTASAAIPGLAHTVFNGLHMALMGGLHWRTRFDAVAFVDCLETVDISKISEADNKCPHCWLPFGTTCEDDPAYIPDGPLSEEQARFAELPFDLNKPNNDPVKTPCGHIFGRDCLIESLKQCGAQCPMCRMDFNASAPVAASD